jgi:carbon-monoxide dehydrogenase large subunit
MGESGLIASPAAVLNAVNDALSPFGVVLRDLPITPEKVLSAMSSELFTKAPSAATEEASAAAD